MSEQPVFRGDPALRIPRGRRLQTCRNRDAYARGGREGIPLNPVDEEGRFTEPPASLDVAVGRIGSAVDAIEDLEEARAQPPLTGPSASSAAR